MGGTSVGGMTVGRLAEFLLVEGVKRVIVTTDEPKRRRDLPRGVEVWDRARSIEAQELLSTVPGVTVLIHEQECAAEKRRKRKRGKAVDPPTRIFINERVCEGCGDCGEKSNCLSVQPVDTEFGRKTAIDQSSCNKDYTCVKGDCPSFLEVIPSTGRKSKRSVAPLEPGDLPDPPPASERTEFSLRLTGIGGTGIVTIAQIIAMAAGFDGWHVRGLDQTGMAQKGGPVISDLRLSIDQQETTNKLTDADCDLYLGCDILVAADPGNLAVAAPERTVAVVSETKVPTGEMVFNAKLPFPATRSLVERIGSRVRADALEVLDADAICEALLGSSQPANILLVGAAYQAGALPISADAIESAIDLNGVAVASNVQAFRRGRQAIADPERLAAAMINGRAAARPQDERTPRAATELIGLVRTGAESELRRLVEIRVPDLIAYQDARYARRYGELVERVRAAEATVLPGTERLANTVAQNLYKLMAYKDEAEVARLSLDPQLRAQLDAEFGAGARFVWKLHPPVFRALGLKRKISLGRWFGPGFRVLYATRRLRGTPLNPFGYGKVRRVERELVDEYVGVLEELIQELRTENHATAVELAGLPDLVRGYEEIKLRNVAVYRERLRELRGRVAEINASSGPREGTPASWTSSS